MKRISTETIVISIITIPPIIFCTISIFFHYFMKEYMIKDIIGLCTFLSVPICGFIAVLVAFLRSEKDFTENENYKKLVGDVSKLSKEERMRKERANGIVRWN